VESNLKDRWGDNIRTDVEEIGYLFVDWILVA
jgi:hypothetical protein